MFLPQLLIQKQPTPTLQEHVVLPTSTPTAKARLKDLTPSWIWHGLKDLQRIKQDKSFAGKLLPMIGVLEPEVI